MLNGTVSAAPRLAARRFVVGNRRMSPWGECVTSDLPCVRIAALSHDPRELFRLPPVEDSVAGDVHLAIDWPQGNEMPNPQAYWPSGDGFSNEIERLPAWDSPLTDWEPSELASGIDGELPSPEAESSRLEMTSQYFVETAWAIRSDHTHFYSRSNLFALTLALGAGATLANTGWDEGIRDTLQGNLVRTASDEYGEFIHNHKLFGEGAFLIPAYFAIAVLGEGLTDQSLAPVAGEWGNRSFRAILVGAPPLMGLQLLTGGSRPGETNHESSWRPFQDDNGVSGHAFLGAIPLLTAARMSDGPWLKAVFYSTSLLPALSRITDDAHYPSQALLGWTLAVVATAAIDQTDHAADNFEIAPWTNGDATGVACLIRW